jgi:hypothetical protein
MKAFYTGKSLFTWAGEKVNRTITLMCKLRVHPDVDYNRLMIYGMSPKHISDILSQPKPSGDELAALVPREDKEEQNYQHILSEERLNHEFACTYLDVDKAWAKLQKLSTQFGTEDFYNDDNMDVDEEFDAEEDYYEVLDDDYCEEYEDDGEGDEFEDNTCEKN